MSITNLGTLWFVSSGPPWQNRYRFCQHRDTWTRTLGRPSSCREVWEYFWVASTALGYAYRVVRGRGLREKHVGIKWNIFVVLGSLTIMAFNPPLMRLHSYLLSKERWLLVATFQDCFDFAIGNLKKIQNIIQITSLVYHLIRYMSG